jgi:CD109 antigen
METSWDKPFKYFSITRLWEIILKIQFQNLDDLIMMPTGCGEQIMANLAPNLYILKYLNAIKNLTPTVKHKIIRNLKIGYQRILNYVHKDGSFSAFGYHDPMGSMFLTAFVVRTLQDLKQYIYVDQKIIERAVSWILSHQLENGCFSTMLHVFQDMVPFIFFTHLHNTPFVSLSGRYHYRK